MANIDRHIIFGKAYRGLRAQGFRRSGKQIEGNFNCLYRGPNNMKCAIGHCISDHTYSGALEHKGAHELDVVRAIDPSITEATEISSSDAEFLRNLQRCHDHGRTPEQMKQRLDAFALTYMCCIPSN